MPEFNQKEQTHLKLFAIAAGIAAASNEIRSIFDKEEMNQEESIPYGCGFLIALTAVRVFPEQMMLLFQRYNDNEISEFERVSSELMLDAINTSLDKAEELFETRHTQGN